MSEKTEEKKVEKPFGLIPGGNYLPENFDMKVEIYSYKFWLMCKLLHPDSEVLERSHDNYLKLLKKRLMDAHADLRLAERNINKIITSAYNTIPGEFWTNLDRKIKLPEPKNSIPDRSYKIARQKPEEDVTYRDGVYIPLKRNKNKKKSHK